MITKEISIIITCYNSKNTIAETLNSVKNQDYDYWECIIVDDCSKDNSVRVIKKVIESDKRFNLLVNKKNHGQAKSLNIGIQNSYNNYIMFLDSDDLLLETCFSNRLKFDFGIYDFLVFPNHLRFSKNIIDIDNYVESKKSENPLKDFITHKLPTPWNIMSMIWKKESILKIGGFNENYVRMVDVEFSTKALILGQKYKTIFIKPDHFYRTTESIYDVKVKRRNFYNASFTFLIENFMLINQVKPPERKKIKKYLFYFFLKVFSLSLVSQEFNKKDSYLILNHAIENNIISKNRMLFPFLIKYKGIIEIKIIRSVFWRSINFYINKG
jgi:glycosyltransferase involved in cell wall biosynthesis